FGFASARVALGLGEGGNFPSAIKSVAQWFPKRERAFATALFNSGSNVGAIIAPAIIPWLAFTWGSQSAFVAAELAACFLLFRWVPLYDSPEKVKRLSPTELEHIQSDVDAKDTAGKVKWLNILRHRQAWGFIAAKFLTDPVWWFFLIWLPDYFKATRGLDIKKSWVHLVTIYAIVTVLSITGGWVTGYLSRRRWSVASPRTPGPIHTALLLLPRLAPHPL